MFSRRSPTLGSQKTRRIVGLLPLFTAVACSDAARHEPTAQTSGDSGSPIANAYSALERGDYAALPGVIAALDQAVASDPTNESSVFYAGVMRLWRTTQRADDPSYSDSDWAKDTSTAFTDLDTARKLNPNDPHAAGFYGIAQVNAGDLVKNQPTIDMGGQILDDAVSLYPAYIHGIQALAFGALAKDNADFPKATEALASTMNACVPGTADAGAATLPYPAHVPSDRIGACSDDGVVAHVWEGFWLTYGDIVAKNGDAANAKIAYETAKSAPHYDKWVLTDTLEERLTDLDSRTQLYTDADSTNDPTTWMQEGHLCVGCHASKQ
jgi:hypothetical protein